jgi:putative flippase GtrA
MNGPLTPFLRFMLTGLLNTGFGYAIYATLVLTGMPLWLAVAGSTVLGVVFNFYSYGSIVFGNTTVRVMPRFLGFYAALGLANYVALKMLVGWGLGPLVSQAVLVPVFALIAYASMRTLVFPAARKAPR